MGTDLSPSKGRLVQSSWLCRDDFDRERMLDMEERVRPVRRRTFAILAVAITLVAPWIGWWPLLFLLPASLFFAAADALMPKVGRPENLMFAAWIGSEITIAGAVALDGGPRVATLSWLAIPVITLSSRFSMRGVVAGVGIAIALTLAVALRRRHARRARRSRARDRTARADPLRRRPLHTADGLGHPAPQRRRDRSADRDAEPQGAKRSRPRARPAVGDHRRVRRRDRRPIWITSRRSTIRAATASATPS